MDIYTRIILFLLSSILLVFIGLFIWCFSREWKRKKIHWIQKMADIVITGILIISWIGTFVLIIIK